LQSNASHTHNPHKSELLHRFFDYNIEFIGVEYSSFKNTAEAINKLIRQI
jgi:hypothetical protein